MTMKSTYFVYLRSQLTVKNKELGTCVFCEFAYNNDSEIALSRIYSP